MTVHVFCVTSSGGLPLFTRKKGDGDPLPFSLVASLNGVHMFGKSQGAIVKSTSTQETTFVWEEFEKSVVLVAAASCSNEWILRRLLHSVFNAMLLFVGIEEIRNMRNPDRLKRGLRVSYPLIDRLLNGVDVGSVSSPAVSTLSSHSKNQENHFSGGDIIVGSGDLLGLSETIICQERSALLACLDAFAECMDSQFACLMVCGREGVATSAWRELHPLERQLLAMLAMETPRCTSSDTPVFLPYKSPTVPFRLVWVLLVPEVLALTLCGPTPGLSEAEHLALQCWGPSADLLRTTTQTVPRNMPLSVVLDNSVLGFLLLHTEAGKYLLCCNFNGKSSWKTGSGPDFTSQEDSRMSPAPSARHRLHVLRTFYHQAVESLVLPQECGSKDNDESEPAAEKNCALEVYWCSEYHKCHGVRKNHNVLCVLYASSVPTNTMRALTQSTLKTLTTDKQIAW